MRGCFPGRPCVTINLLAVLFTAAAFLAGPPAGAQSADARPIVASTPVHMIGQQSYVWRSAIMGGVEYATGIVFNPKRPALMYSRNDTGSIYRFDRTHGRWVSLMDDIPWGESNLFTAASIGLDANDPNTIYVAGGGSQWDTLFDILKTTDGGRHWTRTHLTNAPGKPVMIYMGGNKGAGERLAVDPNDSRVVYYASQRDGLFRSADGAATWHPVASFPTPGAPDDGLTFVTLDWQRGRAGQPTPTVYVGASASATAPGGVYRSGDGGRTWARLTGGPSDKVDPLQGRLASDGALYVPCLGEGLWRWRAGRWTNVTPAGTHGKPIAAVGVHPTDPRQVVCATYDRNLPMPIFFTRDGGMTWTAYDFARGGGSLRVGFQPAWELADPNFKWPTGYVAAIGFDPLDPRLVYTGDWSGANRLTGLGTPVARVDLLSAGREQITCGDVISPSAGALLVSGVWDVGGFRHAALDRIPDRVIPLLPGNPQGQRVFEDIFQLDANPAHPNNLVAAGGWQWNNTGDAAYSDDNGRTLHNFPTKPFPDAKFGRIAQGVDPANVVWAPMGGADTPVYYTKDNGTSWHPGQGGPLGTIATNGPWSFYKELAADRMRPGVFYLYDRRDGRFYRSEDGGADWTHVSTLPKQQGAHFDNNRVLAVPGMPGAVWVCIAGATAIGPCGLYVSRDGGDSWTRLTGVQWPVSFAFGQGRPGGRVPAAYLFAQIGGPPPASDRQAAVQLYRSDDLGRTWTRINDAGHQFAGLNSMAGDGQVWGRVYLSTGGRGIFYGEPDARSGSPKSGSYRVQ